MASASKGFARSDRPPWVRAVNAVGRGLAKVGVQPIALTPDALEARARARSGLRDFGGDDYRESLEVLCRGLADEAKLTPIGRWLARLELSNHLENRLRIVDAFKRHPEIAEVEVAPPIFITGSGRSGTSILHELMSQDPGLRALLHWEALYPAPPPTAEGHASDPRIARGDREVRTWESIAPRYKTMHEGSGSSPQECDFLYAPTLMSDHIANAFRSDSYTRYCQQADRAPGFAWHYKSLQILQWRVPTQQWVLKAPTHLGNLDALFACYPDSQVIVTHRDPLKVMASMSSLVTTLHWLRTDEVDLQTVTKRLVKGVGLLLLHTMQRRDAGDFAGKHFVDVRYVDFVADPVGTTKKVYAELGRALQPEAEARMADYIARKPRDRGHGTHRYSFEDTGLDLAEQREHYRPYMERYGVPEEV